MSVALHPSLGETANAHVLSKLIIGDVAPRKMRLTVFKGYVEGMRKIEAMKLKSRKEAMDILVQYEPVTQFWSSFVNHASIVKQDPTVRAFLLTNLKPITEREPFAKFRVPLDILEEALPELGLFPYEVGERSWEGPTMFIKGLQSEYASIFFLNCSANNML